MRPITLVVAEGRSPNPAKRQIEEALVAAFAAEPGLRVLVVPHLYDLPADSQGMQTLRSLAGDLIVCDWLFPRAIHWVLDRNGVRGRLGATQLDEVEDEEDEEAAVEAAEKERVIDSRELPDRTIFPLNLNAREKAAAFIDEVRRLLAELRTAAGHDLMQWLNGAPAAEPLARYLAPAAGGTNGETNGQPATTTLGLVRIEETAGRRWYPVIDFSRCTNCMECIDFCLFGVYGVDAAQTILVEQPDNCRKGCPACSRVCPENAILFPEHKTPAIAGSPLGSAGSFKIDLSKLFGAADADAVDVAVSERDRELLAAGREAVGKAIGLSERLLEPEAGETTGDSSNTDLRSDGANGSSAAARPPAASAPLPRPKDELDQLIDQLDALEL